VPLPGRRSLELGRRTLVMGVVNVTPDSFSDGGDFVDPDAAIAHARRLVDEGADILDIGGESTRPGAEALPAEEEWRRVGPVLEGLRGRIDVPISIDTYKADVARRALDLGAGIVNDVSALTYDAILAAVVAQRGAAIVLMHNRGRPSTMYAQAVYDRPVSAEIIRELTVRVQAAERAGIDLDRIIVDPGLGFAKRAEHSYAALAGMARLSALGRPILSGPSRKSFLAQNADTPPANRVLATAAAVTASVLGGAHIVRVHDVAAMVPVVRVADAIRAADGR
jgi:dihydropteroate synthase